MIRGVVALMVVLVICLVSAMYFLAAPTRLAARYAAADCQVVPLIDRVTGREISGAEDLAYVATTGAVIVSAHDRMDPARPDGGLYSLPLFALGAGDALTLNTLVPPETREHPFRPHGIAVDEDGQRLAVINRVGEEQVFVEVGSFDQRLWASDVRIRGQRVCRANDLIFEDGPGEALLITIDRGSCDTSIVDLLPGSKSGHVVRFDGASVVGVRDELEFPNGIAGTYVAETRNERLLEQNGSQITLPGGPDNISLDTNGGLVTAVHPALMQLWFYLQGWQGRAPSRIVRADPETGAVEVLFDDPRGDLFSAATSAILVDDKLVAGSVLDSGLLYCEAGG